MISEADVAGLVPDCYAEFRRIVAEGVMFFLEHLSPGRLEQIVAVQATLPAEADVPTRLVNVLHHCPALHKLGQVIARRRELDETLRRRLQQLESMEPRTPFEQIRPILLRELADDIDRYSMRIESASLAEASVAAVVPFTWCDPAESPERRQRGVFKVLKPHVSEHLHEDLAILGKLADYIDERRAAYGLPEVDYRETFEEARAILLHEVRLEYEQAHLVRAGRLYAGRDDVLVPKLLPFSTEHVTAMERIEGVKVTQIDRVPRARRTQLAETVVRALVAEIVFSRSEATMFHADPHAGNLMATDDGRLGILDWSLAGKLTHRDRAQMAQVLVGGVSLNRRRVAEAIAGLAMGKPAESRLNAVAQRAVELLRSELPGVGWLMRVLDDAARAGVRFRSDLMLFRKSYFTLEGVVGDLHAGCTLESVLTRTAVEAFVGEWPSRWLRPLYSRDYATHLSNADLLQMMGTLPWMAVNWWSAAWRNWSNAWGWGTASVAPGVR